MKNVLIEIGTEELPALLINEIRDYLYDKFMQILMPSSGKKFSTPRRLAFLFEGVKEEGEEKEEIIYGPPWHISFDTDSKPTKALIRFLEKNNASLEEVIKLRKEKGEYAGLKRRIKGESPIKKLADGLEEVLKDLPVPKKMRWDRSGFMFPRPIRWIVFLVDKEVVHSRVGNIISDRTTRGHRLLSPDPFMLGDAKDYENKMKELWVIPSFEERKQIIKEGIYKIAENLGGTPLYPEGLIEEVTNLVEYPFILTGSFDEKYLELPDKVIVTVSAHHQRFFCVKSKEGKLLPYFIAVSNNKGKENLIRSGYERVLKARLEDALFFFKEDLKKPLESRVEELKGVLQHPKIGSLYDKVKRLEDIALNIAKDIGIDNSELEKIKRVAKLSKADIVTEMVKEFDELQGYMGYIYALRQGEDPEVAKAIYEHYKPKSMADDLPQTTVGAVLAIADKLDDLNSYFSVGEIPQGSSDPHGLRRSFIGIVRIILSKKWNLDLAKYISVSEELKEFAKQRLINYFDNYPYDVVRAVVEVYGPFAPLEVKNTIEDLNTARDKEEFKDIIEAYRRISRIIPKGFDNSYIDETLLKEEAELELYSVLRKLGGVKKFLELYELVPYINKFFDQVLVMEKDERLRNNRLALLLNIKKLFMRFGDLDQIVSKEVVRNG